MLTDLALGLAEERKRVCVVTGRQTYEDPSARLPARETHESVEVHRIWTTRFGRGNLIGRGIDYVSFYLSAFLVLLWLARPGDTIVAKTDPPLISIVGWVVARLKGASLVNWLQDVFPEVAVSLGVLRNGFVSNITRRIRNSSLRAARMNVVLGERMRDRIAGQDVPKERITVIHNWADSTLIKPVSHEDNPLREQLRLGSRFVVGYSGNMGRAHEFHTIIDAMNRLKDDPAVSFLFIGGGAAKTIVEQAVETFGLTNAIFLPYQPREYLAQSLSVADVHLVSLRPELEGLIVPSKFYGIAAAGRPVLFVGDPKGEIPQLIERHGCGFSFPVGAGDLLSERIRKLAGDREEALRLGRIGRRCLVDRYDRAHSVGAWKSLLDTLALPVRQVAS